jgi:5-formaminoimidazole-4-carboxamide-1-beta-D-ribofuranosyl 5'-monophosphate synthetase
MHNELRYQAKTHTTFEKLSKEKIKFYIFSPNFYFFYFFYYVENNKTEK